MSGENRPSIDERLVRVQSELKAPKGQYNDFGGYRYRSCEDILEAVKPLLKEHGLTLTITDSIEHVGDRYYVKATARLVADGGASGALVCEAYAREQESKKGSDPSQITGMASSYARKYALNGLFLIDDAKDADAQEQHGKTPRVLKCATDGCSAAYTFAPGQEQDYKCPKCGGSKWVPA